VTKAERRAAAAALSAASSAPPAAPGASPDDGEGDDVEPAAAPEFAAPDVVHCPVCGLRLVLATRQCPIDPDDHTPARE